MIRAAALASFVLVACGGGQKPSTVTPPGPDTKNPQNGKPKAPVRTLKANDKKAFAAAVKLYTNTAKAGWNKQTCERVAKKFAEVASDNSKLVEARFNAGTTYQQCGMYGRAKSQFEAAIKAFPKYGEAIANLGDIYYMEGNRAKAKQLWEKALKINSKLASPYANLAWLKLERLRKMKAGDEWKKLEKDIRRYLSASLAVDNSDVRPYVIYSLVWMEGSERNRNRLALADLLLKEGLDRDKNFAPAHNAQGLLHMKRDRQGLALKSFRMAVQLDANYLEARMNLGSIFLSFRKYKEAVQQFTYVLSKQPKNYNAMIGLAKGQRGRASDKDVADGTKWYDTAEATLKKAQKLNGKLAHAYYNLGVLYKDFRQAPSSEPKVSGTVLEQGIQRLEHGVKQLNASKALFKKAKGYFQQAISKSGLSKSDLAEAKENMGDCDKTVSNIDIEVKRIQVQVKQMKAMSKSASSSGAGAGAGASAGSPVTP